MSDFIDEVASFATQATEMAEELGLPLDYSPQSLELVEQILEHAKGWLAEMSETDEKVFVQWIGCYILEVGRKQFEGTYYWHQEREQPVLVVGEPESRIAIATWDKVSGRLHGDEGDNIPFFYDGFAGLAKNASPGDDILYT